MKLLVNVLFWQSTVHLMTAAYPVLVKIRFNIFQCHLILCSVHERSKGQQLETCLQITGVLGVSRQNWRDQTDIILYASSWRMGSQVTGAPWSGCQHLEILCVCSPH